LGYLEKVVASYCSHQKPRIASLRVGFMVATGGYGLAVTTMELLEVSCFGVLTLIFLFVSCFSIVLGIATMSLRVFSVTKEIRNVNKLKQPYAFLCKPCCQIRRCHDFFFDSETRNAIAHRRPYILSMLAIAQAGLAYCFLICPGMSPPSIPMTVGPFANMNDSCPVAEWINQTELTVCAASLGTELFNPSFLVGISMNSIHLLFAGIELTEKFYSRRKEGLFRCAVNEMGWLIAAVAGFFVMLADLPLMLLPFFYNILIGFICNDPKNFCYAWL